MDRFVVGVHRTPSDNPGTDLPARSPAGMASSDLLPSDLKRPGLMRQPVSGCIVSVRERTFGPREGSAQNGTSPPKGKGKAKKNAKGPQIIKEFHLNGGSSPASVVLVEIWIPEVYRRCSGAAVAAL